MNNPEPLRPTVTTDVVIFTVRDARLELLLARRDAVEPAFWALPGGGVRRGEDLDHSARRRLEEQTGVAGVYLEQLYTFGRPDRDADDWLVTVAYYALIPSDRSARQAAIEARGTIGWFDLAALPALRPSQAEIVTRARQRLAAKLDYSTIALQFMPEKFSLSELQAVYEIVRRERLDKRNFRKWVLGLGYIEETDEVRRDGSHRPARLYRARDPGTVQIIK